MILRLGRLKNPQIQQLDERIKRRSRWLESIMLIGRMSEHGPLKNASMKLASHVCDFELLEAYNAGCISFHFTSLGWRNKIDWKVLRTARSG